MSGIVSDIMRSMSFTVEPPDAEAGVRKELVLPLYAYSILGFGKARELRGLTKLQFEECRGRRKAFRPYFGSGQFYEQSRCRVR